ncbi:MAG: TrkH family potassium uptake protein [Thermoleophilia bacterium]|nr:TrkH family potassium uptake protein [Thermoleophilia bacterium]
MRAAPEVVLPPPRIGPRRRVAVDLEASVNLLGTLTAFLGLAALVPIAVAALYGEPIWPFLVAGGLTSGFGLALQQATRGAGERVRAREGFLVISATWLLAACFGALPYLLAGGEQFADPVDALFEGMSGFTTTGATVVTDFDALPNSLKMWRQLTQWLGGLGIIVLALAVLPRLRVGGRQLFETELPGPEVDQLGVRIRHAVQRFWVLYVGLTVSEAAILTTLGFAGIDEKMTPFNAIAHALTTIPTGGFSTEERSIGTFAPATQWVIVVFMVLAGTNLALLYYAFVRGRLRPLLRDEETRLYVTLLALASAVLLIELVTSEIEGSDAPLRHGVFQAVAIMTGTGYATVDFAAWPTLALMTLVLLMFVGGSAGSTTGSVKVIRHLVLGRVLRRELTQTLRPEVVMPIRLSGAVVDEKTLRAIVAFVLLYLGLFVAGAGIIAVDASLQGPEMLPIDAISAAAATLGNVGPAAGPAGPMDSYAPFSDLSTLVMIALMWLGRLEVLPIVVLFTRSYWRP